MPRACNDHRAYGVGVVGFVRQPEVLLESRHGDRRGYVPQQATGVMLPVTATVTIRMDANGDGAIDSTDDYQESLAPTQIAVEGMGRGQRWN